MNVDPVAIYDNDMGSCHLGIAPDATVALMAFDSTVGVVLTAIFVRILWPAVRSKTRQSVSVSSKHITASRFNWLGKMKKQHDTGEAPPERRESVGSTTQKQFKTMLWWNVLGSAAVLANTIINNVIYLTWKHSRRSQVCLMTCMTDSMCGVAPNLESVTNRNSCLGNARHKLADYASSG